MGNKFNSVTKFGYLIIAALFFIFSYHALSLNPNIPQGDQWVWVKHVLIPFYENEKTFIESVLYEYEPLSHSHILTLITFTLNSQFLSLNLNLDTVIGLISIGVLIFFFSRLIAKTESNASPVTRSVATVLSALILMSFSSTSTLSWSLITFEFLYLMIAVMYAYGFIKYIKRELNHSFIIFLTFSYFLGDAMSVAMILASVAIGLLYISINKANYIRFFIFLTSLALLIYLSFNLEIFQGGRSHSSSSKIDALRYIAQNWELSLEMFINGFSRGYFNLPSAKIPLFNGLRLRDFSIILGILTLCSALTFLLFSFFNKKNSNTLINNDSDNWFCFLLMAFSAVCIFGVILTRLIQFDINYIFGQRYVRFASIFAIATLILYIKSPFPAKARFAFNSVFISCIAINLFLAHFSFFVMSGYSKNYFKIREAAIQNGSFGEHHRRCSKGYCDISIEFLKENNLNQFAN